MTLTPGTRFGPYEIAAEIGSGGMGVVYRARDSRLGRDVAIKVLPAAMAADPDRLQRFEQEARAAAALNHPNILAVYDIGWQPADPAHPGAGPTAPYIVSELLDGESLRDRVAAGPIPARKAVDYAVQIAHGLAAAHDKGIVHRDLKPGNVFVADDGRVKILDFGLAKLTQAEPMLAGASALPTAGLSPPQTVPGMVLGTLGYMAPEQVRGMAADHRADLFALGVVLYEMLTGRRAFAGETTADVMSAILRAEPPEIEPALHVPPALARIVSRCLEKHPASRFQSARDLAFALEGLSTHSGEQPALVAPARLSRRDLIGLAVAAPVFGLAGALGTWTLVRPVPPALQELSVLLPAEHPIAFGWSPGHSIAISRDGTMLAYAGLSLDRPSGERQRRLFIRSLDHRAVRALSGTEGASQPFFSPNGRWVAFFGSTDGIQYSLKKAPLAGGSPIEIMRTGGPWNDGVWLDDDTIVVGGAGMEGLKRISAEGRGAPEALTTLGANEDSHWSVTALPGGRELVFAVRSSDLLSSRIEAVSLDSGVRRTVLEYGSAPTVAGGHLLFRHDDQILLAPFDASQGIVTGSAVPLVHDIRRDGSPSVPGATPQLAVSAGGTFAYVPAAAQSDATIGIVSRDGSFEPIGRPDRFSTLSVSPDGVTVAVSVSRGGRGQEVLLIDTRNGSTNRLHFTQQGRYDTPVWLSDAALAVSRPGEDGGIVLKEVSGGREQLLAGGSDGLMLRNMSSHPDGRQLAYTRQSGGGGHDIWLLTLDNSTSPEPLHENPWREHSPQFSPEGHWLAYVSEESGRGEIWVQRFPRGQRRQVSHSGGLGPIWSADGRELYFQTAGDGTPRLMVVAVDTAADRIEVGDPQPLLDLRVTGPTGLVEMYALSGNGGARYGVLPNGRFVMIRGADPQTTREIVLVQNFDEDARRVTGRR